ncbi:LOW QUALITY PROTEIN: protein SLX4IP [Microcaecilia unicolor]|uniref:LOW QUALITY PROTEIN: protein SLX4IP n=1 Tax=Microcaecilia unicolor TaxID=1415580 RepID=A0A6P7XP90_9AMPH|nr:LOW QUALITY PROTEIN: protein SLX4IP [Microcaecilia unicolor]
MSFILNWQSMASNKMVIKCGKFAVLVDLHILPQGSSKDTSWFSDHEKEEISTLVKDIIDSRVKQYLESRKQHVQSKHKEVTQFSPLFLKGSHFRIAVYFMKRWVNLRCIVKEQFHELRVFPEKFVVCASLPDCDSRSWATESGVQQDNYFSETSEYFNEASKDGKYIQRKQVILKELVEKTRRTNKNAMKVTLGSENFETGCRKSEHQASSDLQSEAECRSTRQPINDYINTAKSSSELPVSEMENDVNQRQPDDASSQQKPHFVEWLETRLLGRNSSWSCESAPPDPKQSQRPTITQPN